MSHNTVINIFALQISLSVGTEIVTLKLTLHKIGDSFFAGVPMQPMLVLLYSWQRKGRAVLATVPGFMHNPEQL